MLCNAVCRNWKPGKGALHLWATVNLNPNPNPNLNPNPSADCRNRKPGAATKNFTAWYENIASNQPVSQEIVVMVSKSRGVKITKEHFVKLSKIL